MVWLLAGKKRREVTFFTHITKLHGSSKSKLHITLYYDYMEISYIIKLFKILRKMQRGIECVATMLVERPKVPKEAAEDHLKDRKKSKIICKKYIYI